MKKKVLSVLLVTAMAGTMLAGCGESGGSSVDSSAVGAETEEGYSTEIDMDEDPYTVAIQVVTLPGADNSDSLEAREEAINEITVPAINCKVELQDVWISELANTTSMGISKRGSLCLVGAFISLFRAHRRFLPALFQKA